MKLTRLDKAEMTWIVWRPLIWATLLIHAFFGVFWWPYVSIVDFGVLAISVGFDRYLVLRMPEKEEPAGYMFRVRGVEYRPKFTYKGFVILGSCLRVHHWVAEPVNLPSDTRWDEIRFVKGTIPARSLITMALDRDLVETDKAKEPT